MTTTAQIDRRAVMLEAWRATRAQGASNIRAFGLRNLFRAALVQAWAEAKRRAFLMAKGAAYLRAMAEGLTAKRWLTDAEAAAEREYYALAAEAERIEAEARAVAELADKAALIRDADRATVTFIKADGSKRVMQVARQIAPVAPKGSIAAKTRKARHPHLLPVWDAEKEAVRSINLATVTRIETAGGVASYA